jgi:hypothetical protein
MSQSSTDTAYRWSRPVAMCGSTAGAQFNNPAPISHTLTFGHHTS